MRSRLLKSGMLVAAVVGMIACNKPLENNDEEKAAENQQQIEKYLADSALTATRDPSGLYYVIKKANPTGAKPKAEESVKLNFTAYTLDGTQVLSSVNTDKIPFVRPYDLGFLLRGMEIALHTMRVGESASIYMPFYLAFGAYAQGNVPAYAAIKMNMELVSSRTETQQIDDYITEKALTVTERSTDNLIIIRTNVVPGDTLGTGKSVQVNYKGKLLTGASFAISEKPISFTTGANQVVPGFDRAIRKMRRGEKATIIFPSPLGYGKNGVQNSVGNFVVFPYSPLQYEVEVL